MTSGLEPRQAAAIVVLATLWGVSFVLVKVAVEEIPPAMTVFLRTLTALLFLLIALPRRERQAARGLVRRKRAAVLALAALQVAIPFLLVSLGEQEIPAGLTSILIATESLFVGLLAPFFDASERLSRHQLGGLLIGLVGIGVVVGVEAVGSTGEILGASAVLGASLAYALGSFLAKRRFKDESAPSLALVTVAIGAVLVAPAALLEPPAQMPSLSACAAIVGMGVGGTAIAFLLFYRLVAEVGAGRALLSTYLAPVAALTVAVLALGEQLAPHAIGGLALILAGVILASRRTVPALPH